MNSLDNNNQPAFDFSDDNFLVEMSHKQSSLDKIKSLTRSIERFSKTTFDTEITEDSGGLATSQAVYNLMIMVIELLDNAVYTTPQEKNINELKHELGVDV